MFGRSDAEFRAHRNRRKSRLGKYNAEADRHFIPQPSPIIAPRRTLASRMNQVLYQEAALKRKTEAAKANPKKCLFSEPGYENTTDYSSMKAQKTAPYSTQYGFSAVEDHDVTGVYPMEDQSKTRILGGMEHQYTSGFRLPLKDHNFRPTATTTKPIHQLFKNFTTSTDSAKKCLKKQQQMLHWNVVQSPIPPQLSAFSNSKTLSVKTIESPVMPRLSTLPHALESAVKIKVVPPEETGKPEDITQKGVGMQNFNHPTTEGQKESPMLNFKYPVTDESKSPITKVADNFRYPTTGQLNDCSRAQTKLPNCSYDVKAGSNSGNDVTNLNFPVPNFNFPPSNTAIDLSKLTNFNYPVSWKTNDCGLNNSRNPSDLCDPVPKQALYSENEASRDTSNMLVVDQKTKRMAARQRKMSVSEMEFEKICQMRSEGSESLLVDFCRNGKSDSEENDFENTKEVKENVRPKQETNHGGRRSISSNIVNGNGTRRSVSSNIVNGIGTRRSFTSTIVNGNSKLKQPQCYASKVDRKLQQPSVSDPNHHKESPKFIIRKRKDSFISNDTVDEDSFNNYDTILNNYESSTLIVNDPNIDDSLKAVDNIDETLSNIQLDDVVGTTFSAHPGETSCEINGGVMKTVEKANDVEEEKDGDTFVVQKNLFAGKFYEENGGGASNVYAEKNRNLGDTFLIPNNTSRKVLFDDKKFREVNKASLKNEEELINNRSVDLGVETLNESLDNTLRFVQNETLCEDDENEITSLDSGVKNNVERDLGEAIDARTNSGAEINAGKNLEQEMDVNRLVETETDVKNSVGERFTKNMETVEDNTLSSQNCQIAETVLNNGGSEHQDSVMSKLMEKHKLLVRKSEILFESRKQIMSQIKLLEESLIEQEEQFNELNGEFLGLFREFGEVVTNKQKGNDQVTVFNKINNENIDDAANSGVINNEKVSEIVPFSVRKTVFDTPRSARRVRRNLVFSQLKSDFSCLKTPLPSTAKKLHESTANKTILTPKSMSVCIQDQVNQLFDS